MKTKKTKYFMELNVPADGERTLLMPEFFISWVLFLV
ncbi:hypothetical protein HDC92_001064 [Pedobacter sp. AK017]|nr:hypothetical protein [Pedobacter sp. AK017]